MYIYKYAHLYTLGIHHAETQCNHFQCIFTNSNKQLYLLILIDSITSMNTLSSSQVMDIIPVVKRGCRATYDAAGLNNKGLSARV